MQTRGNTTAPVNLIGGLEQLPGLGEKRSQRRLGDPYLRLQLTPDTTAVLATDDTQEVLVVPGFKLTVMPNMPNVVLGLLNHRNRVIWVIDLPLLLGLPALSLEVPQLTVAIIRPQGEKPLGLAVPQIRGLVRLEAEAIQSPVGTVAAGLIPYLCGCCLNHQEILLVLAASAITQSLPDASI
ncbi:chemotaxis protein CheW [Thermosynechococcaceae cyanobacterium BACA0444]|uniref:Chemotaxis protein CheW n=1 Tax=Pseudocalidococcus azoricus BACA0444 TaxID=2918990 RepID=A0AAE4FVB3_9CYAN|nr:chemotaxis protein CheW [Pseudocalidococcus azoricus]MDS3861984.1 chemotaxis protein CheW [Pseudocalidococcus azoricus BACA0444]